MVKCLHLCNHYRITTSCLKSTPKLSAYIARTANEDIRDQYLDRIENSLVVDYVKEISIELDNLESKGTFDDPEVLRRLYEIIDKYFNVFMNRYAK